MLFYPAVYSWFPCPLGLPNLLTLHDAIAEHFPDLVFPRARYRAAWNLKVRLARAQASRFLTVSDAAREEIVAYMGIARERIDLTTEGPKAQFRAPASAADRARLRTELAARFKLPEGTRTFCFVGGFAPHKNLLGLLDAFEQVVQGGPGDVHLLLVGDPGGAGFHSNLEQLNRRLADDAQLAARVHFTGFVDDDTLAAIYAASIGTVLPSFSEGFGLPIVESMACGTPVLAARVGSMPEIGRRRGRAVRPARHRCAGARDAPVERRTGVAAIAARACAAARRVVQLAACGADEHAAIAATLPWTGAMKFCMVSTFYPPFNFGGDGIYVQALSRELLARGHEVTVVHCMDAYRLLAKQPAPADDEQLIDGVRVVRLQSRWGALSPLLTQQTGLPLLKRERLRRLFAEGFDVVNFHNISLVGGPAVLRIDAGDAIKLYTLHEHWLLCPTHVFWKNRERACDTPTCLSCCLRSGVPPQAWRATHLIEDALQHVQALLAPSEFTPHGCIVRPASSRPC